MAMGQNPVPPVNIPQWVVNSPTNQNGIPLVLTTTAKCLPDFIFHPPLWRFGSPPKQPGALPRRHCKSLQPAAYFKTITHARIPTTLNLKRRQLYPGHQHFLTIRTNKNMYTYIHMYTYALLSPFGLALYTSIRRRAVPSAP